MTPQFRCCSCQQLCEPISTHGADRVPYGEGYTSQPWSETVSDCCNEHADPVVLCDCGEHEPFDGYDFCAQCAADLAVESPAEMASYTPALVKAVAAVMAERLRPWLRQPQAGGDRRTA
jgi:hypothetical protein